MSVQSKYAVTSKEMRCIRLEWDAITIDRDLKTFQAALTGKKWDANKIGLYAIEGKHNAHPQGTVLYIGMTDAAGAKRPSQSVRARLFNNDPEPVMYGSYWDMTLRWVYLSPEERYPDDPEKHSKSKTLTQALEKLLIVSLKPPLNANGVDDWLDGNAWDLVVGNVGNKGLLPPMLHGHDCFWTHDTTKADLGRTYEPS